MTRWNDKEWNYLDVVTIFVQGGRGGHGCKSFRREYNRPNGGPDGGNGGHGGHVYVRCVESRNSLASIKERVHYEAQQGVNGMGKELHGKNGQHEYVDVPPGSVIYVQKKWVEGQDKGKFEGRNGLVCWEDIRDREVVAELLEVGQVVRVARGGRGGRGNHAFKTHVNRNPWIKENGEPGKGRWLDIELKMIADIGIIGVPNAGKSSLLAAVTAAVPNIAPYPFSTVMPNLGNYEVPGELGSLTLCDIPGLIEGAHEGRGMGFQFLRHIERCKTLIHIVSAASEDPLRDFDQIQEELRQYSPEVASKPQVVVVNKCDIPEAQEMLPELISALKRRCGHTRVFEISCATQYRVHELMRRVVKWHKSVVEEELRSVPNVNPEEAAIVVDSRKLSRLGGAVQGVNRKEPVQLDPERKRGERLPRGAYVARVEWDVLEEAWRLIHPEVERVAKTMDWSWSDSSERFNRVCKATGMTEALAAQDIEDGAWVICVTHKFQYSPSAVGRESRMLLYDMDMSP